MPQPVQLKQKPVVSNQIIEQQMPTQMILKSSQNFENPEQQNNDKQQGICLKQFTVKGKGIFSMQPKYQQDEKVDTTGIVFSVKAFDEYDSNIGGLRKLWQSVVGYSKRQVLFEDGYIYTLLRTKQGLMRHGAHQICKLLKIFVDEEENIIRLVFRQEGNKRINRNYRLQNLSAFMERLVLQANVLGLQIIQDQVY